MSELEVRAFRAEDLRSVMPPERIAETPADWSAHGLTVTLAGKPVAVGGLVLIRNHWWTFAEITEPARRPMTVHRLVLRGLRIADECGIDRIYGYCDEAYPRAKMWIESMGFRPAAEADRNEDVRAVESMVRSPAWIRGKSRGH